MATHEEAAAQKQRAARIAAKIWNHVVEPDPDAAVTFVNLDPAQGAGEVSMTNRADGAVDVYYFL